MTYRTDEELERLWYMVGATDISEAFRRAGEAESLLESLEGDFEKRYEVQLEQSEFRRELIERIVEMCSQEGTKKDLVKAIKTALENSFVEL